MGVHNQESIDVQNPEERPQDSLEPTNLFSMLRLNSINPSSAAAAAATVTTTTPTGCDLHLHHPPCTACGCSGSNSVKRRSPSSCSSLQDPSCAAVKSDFEPRAKKLFCGHEFPTLHGFSAISLPLSLEALAATQNAKPTSPVLRRCISDTYSPPAATVDGYPPTPFHSPEHANGAGYPSASASRLPPLPPSLKRCVSDPTPSPAKAFCLSSSSGDMGVDLTKEETSNSMRLRRMKDRLGEMRQWWNEVMQEEEDFYEGDKVVCKDDNGGGVEEVVSVEWAEKCLSITFKCPCGKGYQILLSGNNCYYKLV